MKPTIPLRNYKNLIEGDLINTIAPKDFIFLRLDALIERISLAEKLK
jgi:hypothetical protein